MSLKGQQKFGRIASEPTSKMGVQSAPLCPCWCSLGPSSGYIDGQLSSLPACRRQGRASRELSHSLFARASTDIADYYVKASKPSSEDRHGWIQVSCQPAASSLAVMPMEPGPVGTRGLKITAALSINLTSKLAGQSPPLCSRGAFASAAVRLYRWAAFFPVGLRVAGSRKRASKRNHSPRVQPSIDTTDH
jgi:hypothetical protein